MLHYSEPAKTFAWKLQRRSYIANLLSLLLNYNGSEKVRPQVFVRPIVFHVTLCSVPHIVPKWLPLLVLIPNIGSLEGWNQKANGLAKDLIH